MWVRELKSGPISKSLNLCLEAVLLFLCITFVLLFRHVEVLYTIQIMWKKQAIVVGELMKSGQSIMELLNVYHH